MKITFREEFRLPLEQVYSYFQSPREWPRLYGLAGDVRERGEGWVSVPLQHFPFPLLARNTDCTPLEHVRWEFRGFWKGSGEVRFYRTGRQTVVEGYEEISIRWLGILSTLIERLFLQRTFRSIWALGWRRLRKAEQGA